MRLWSGDGSPTACRCELGTDALGHAKTDDLHNDRFCLREQLWTKVNYYLVALMLSGRPLTKSTLGPGIRPEVLMKGGWSPKMGTSLAVLAKEPKLQMSDGDDAKVAALAAVGPQLGGEPSLIWMGSFSPPPFHYLYFLGGYRTLVAGIVWVQIHVGCSGVRHFIIWTPKYFHATLPEKL